MGLDYPTATEPIMFIEIHDYIAQKRQDARDAYDYARSVGTSEPTEADLDLFLEFTNGNVFSVSQTERDQIVFEIINAK
jgi:hypothetical protein